MTDKNQSVSKDAVFSAIVTEAAGFYRLVMTVASSFLGGSLLFLDKIAPSPSMCSILVLGLGWLFLIGSVVTVAFVRRGNLESGYKALEEKYDEARTIDEKTRRLSTFAAIFLAAGMFFLMTFGIINLL